MASTATKWAIGCGAGCLIVVLILAALIFGGVFFVRGFVEEVERAEATAQALEKRFGEVEDFRPEPGGAIPAERVEMFLAVRETVAPARDEMAGTFSALSGSGHGEEEESAGGMFSKMRAGLGLLPSILEYFAVRNDALLRHEMGLGEYYYIYSIAYYSWLEKSPADGPPFQLVSGSADGTNWRLETNDRWGRSSRAPDEASVREQRFERTTRTANRLITPMLRHQLEDLDESGGGDPAWRSALAAEIAALERDSMRLPWAGGSPAAIASSLEPFRDELERGYSPLCNGLEFGLGHN